MRVRRFEIHRIARKAGGLSAGARLHFPVSIWDGKCSDNPNGTGTTWQSVRFAFDIIAWSFSFCIEYRIERIV